MRTEISAAKILLTSKGQKFIRNYQELNFQLFQIMLASRIARNFIALSTANQLSTGFDFIIDTAS